MDYTIFYKENLNYSNLGKIQYDLFISAYNSNERVIETFKNVNSGLKHWLIFPEFEYEVSEYPQEDQVVKVFDMKPSKDTYAFIRNYLVSNNLHQDHVRRLCIDITGFNRPSLIYFIRLFANIGIKKFDVIYSEPGQYVNQEDTRFSELPKNPEPIPGCSKINQDNNKDLLIIASGYDYQLILKVANAKKHCKIKCQIFGFPSLQPDMYQENRLTASYAADSIGDEVYNYFAPANDPFVTAQKIQEIVKQHSDYTNLYLSPLSTKAQTLGFILYYLYEGERKDNVSIIFPHSEKYSKKTSIGVAKLWKYTIELP